MELIKKIKPKEAKIGVIGLGYVGLPLVIRFCEENFHVIGFDVDSSKVEKLNRGQSYIKHIHYPALAMKSVSLSEEKLKQYDCAVIITDHSRYDYPGIVKNSRLVVDTRNALKNIKSSKIVKA